MPKVDFRVHLPDERLPVQAFFNCIYDDSFVQTIIHLLNGIGGGVEDVFCEFPEEGDTFEGVRFRIPGEVVVISVEEMRDVLVAACLVQARALPSQAEEIVRVLADHGLASLERPNTSLERTRER